MLEDRALPSSTVTVAVAGPSWVTAGAVVAYAVTVSNAGPSDATGVTLTDALPSGTSPVSQAQLSGPAFTLGTSAGAPSDTIATLPSGTTAVLNVLVSVPASTTNGAGLTDAAALAVTSATTGSSVLSASAATTAYTTGPVSVINPGNQSSTEGGTVSLSISASDPSSGTLHYTASGLPPGLSINPSSGAVSGTVALGAAADSPYTTTVTAGDGTFSAGQTFTWTISSPVSLTNPGAQSTAEGAAASLSLSASDGSGGTLSYSAVGLPPGLAINTGSGAVTGTVGAGAAADGPYSVTVTAADGTYGASQTFTWTITGPVSLVQPPDQSNTEGDSVSLSINGSGSGTLVYGATGLPPGLAINTGTGAITGTVAAGDAANGPYSVTVTVGNGSSSAGATFTWNVADPISFVTPADQTDDEGDSVSLSISANDSHGGTLTYGALGLPAGLSISSAGAISGTVGAGSAGSYTVTLLAEDGTYSAQTSFSWTINGLVAITQPADQTNNAGDTVSLAVSTSGGGTPSYSANGLPPGLSINSTSGVISGTISAGGSFAPAVTATASGDSASASFNWTVSSPITLSDDGPQAFNVGDTVSVPITTTDTASGTLSYSASSLPSGLSINSTSGVISGTISSSLSAGVYNSAVTVTDGTQTAVDTFAWTISPASTVVVTNPGTQNTAEAGTASLSISASYSGGGTLKYAADGLPPGLKINPAAGAISGTVSAGDAGQSPYSATVTATDGTASDSQTFTWNVSGRPAMGSPGAQTTAEGAAVSLSISASGTDGSLTFAALGLPPGLAISPTSGTISGTVAAGAAAQSPYSVMLMVSSGAYTTTEAVTWTVTSPVTVTAPADQTNNDGDSVTLSISASDSTSGTLKYAALGLPPGLKINTGTGAISGTVAGGDAANGSYSVTVLAGDGTYSASTTFNWTINSPVSVTAPADQTNNDGDRVSLAVSASGSGTLAYSAVGLPPGLSINASTGTITGTITTGAAGIGSYSPTITVSNGTSAGTASFNWTVGGPISITDPGSQTNVVGDTVSLQVGTTYTGGGTLVYAASGLPSGLSLNTGIGLISGTITSAATAIGSFNVTVTVEDGTNSATDTFTWSVSSAGSITLTTPSNQTSAEGASASLSLSATGGGTKRYFAERLPAGLKINPTTGAITGTVAVNGAAYGPYTVTVIATDGTNFAEETFTWTITDPVTIATVSDQTSSEGGTVSLSISASDSSSGTLKYGAVGLPGGLTINTGTGAISGTVSPGDAASGPYTVTVIAGDGTYSAATTFTWTVNGAITIAQPADQSNVEGDAPTLTVSATGGGTKKYFAVGLPAGLAINTNTGLISGSVAAGDAAIGSYRVTITASDGTYSASTTFNWTINSPITITDPGEQDDSAGESVSLQVQASDTSSGTWTYFAFGLPAGLAINAITGFISGIIGGSSDAAGFFNSVIGMTDGTHTTLRTLGWSVLGPVLGFDTQLVWEETSPTFGDLTITNDGFDAKVNERSVGNVGFGRPKGDPDFANAWFDWSLNYQPKNEKAVGWVVQQITYTIYVDYSVSSFADWSLETGTYWEATPINQKDPVNFNAPKNKEPPYPAFPDQFGYTSPTRTFGYSVKTGEAVFVEAPWTPDDTTWVAYGKPDHVDAAYLCTTTTTKPSWWPKKTNAAGFATSTWREVSISWWLMGANNTWGLSYLARDSLKPAGEHTWAGKKRY